ncbi:hypothetical protein PLICBS_000146 [Purpureocillium lilacinum]|uniref:uncharacterized protein n=1 Tax=Purpureocillium lilacinum TaxID=33203 RepID=UPI0020820E50|nr:hypothetical protein PLICBS_000146 [Purpureocillium lilacinum]
MQAVLGPAMTWPTVLGCIAALGLARLAWLITYRLYLHPLSSYPGPLLGKVTGLYMIAMMVAGKATSSRYEWHKRYGSVVRTGPDELCFADEASIKDIYGQSSNPCPKAAPFYSGISLNIADSVFAAVDRGEHARMRRLLAHQFSAAGISQCVGEITDRVKMFCEKLRTSAQPVDVHDLTHDLYLDIISQLSFAKSFDLLKGKHSDGARDMETYFSIAPLYGIFPVAKYLPFGIFAAAQQARPRIVKFVQSCIDDFRERIASEVVDTGGLLRQMMEAQDSEVPDGDVPNAGANKSFSDAELIENAVLFLKAGSETTATTLVYLIYEVGIRPAVYSRLVEEVRAAFPDRSTSPDLETAINLPYLNCVIQEVLRLRGPASAMAPRISPGKVIAGKYRFEIEVDRTRTTDDMMKLRDMGLQSPMGRQLWISVKTI